MTERQKVSEEERICISCQKCCGELRFYTHPSLYACPYDDLVEFYKARGCGVTESDGLLVISLKHPCPHLTDKGCAKYKRRPSVCKENSAFEELGGECLLSSMTEKKRTRKK